jgi:hypothetical protein
VPKLSAKCSWRWITSAAELRQAVFVYDGTCLSGTGAFSVSACPGVTNFLPSSINTANTIPVLAFWRVDQLPQVLINLCATNSANLNLTTNPNPPAGINGVPCLSRRTYSLVVYYLDTTNTGGTWAGRARLKRYELTQFTATGAPNTGWVDPTTTNNNFLGWPYAATGTNLQTQGTLSDGSTNPYVGTIAGATVTPPVLVDFVDDPTTPNSTATECPGDSVAAGSLPPFRAIAIRYRYRYSYHQLLCVCERRRFYSRDSKQYRRTQPGDRYFS